MLNLPDHNTEMLSFTKTLQDISKIWDVNSYCENDDFIIFRYRYGFKDFVTVIYHKTNGEVKLARYLSKDLIYENDDSGWNEMFAFSDKKGVYEILNNRMIVSLQESIRNNETVLGLDKADELLQLDAESNPIIFFYEYK